VVFGHFVEGLAKIGSTSVVEINGVDTTVKIIGIEMGNPGSYEIVPFGLLLSFDPDYEKFAITNRIKEQTIDIDFQ